MSLGFFLDKKGEIGFYFYLSLLLNDRHIISEVTAFMFVTYG